MNTPNNKCKVIDMQAWREKKAAEKAQRDRIESPVIEAATEDIQETRAALDGLIAGMVADAHEAGLTVQELGDLIEASDISGFCSDDNLFISKQAFLNALGELGWRSKFPEYTQKDRAVMEELARLYKKGLTVQEAIELILKKRDFNGTILTKADIKKSLKTIGRFARFAKNKGYVPHGY